MDGKEAIEIAFLQVGSLRRKKEINPSKEGGEQIE